MHLPKSCSSMKLLENTRIQLRALEPEDLDVLYHWENDPDIWHLSNTLAPFSKYTLKNTDKKILGAVDLFDFEPIHQRAGVGILIGEESDRKLGFATEALECLREYAFKTLGLKQLYCNICEDNPDSLKLFIKQGYVITGQKKDWIKKSDKWYSEYILQLVRN